MKYRLAVGCEDELHILSYDSVRNRLDAEASQSDLHVQALLWWRDVLLVGTPDGVRAYSNRLEERDPPFHTGFLAATAADEVAFFATEGAIVARDQALREISRIPLVDGRKDAHDVLAIGPRLYALDNVVYPVYAVLVDCNS